jgi:glycosyltransferase involved in cell wall biosynthesis
MRIARIIEYFPPHVGGMERHGLALTRGQIKLGHEVDVFIGIGGELKSDFGEFLKSDFKTYKMPLQFFPLYSKVRRFWFNIWTYFAIKQSHKKNPYDIVHLHGDFVEAFLGGKLAKKLGIPAVLTIHAGLNKKLLKPKNAKYFSNINKIICVSQEIADDLKNIGVSENKLTVISSGIYLSDFENKSQEEIQEISRQYSKPVVISVGVLRRSKGQIYLIEAFKKLKNNFNSATLLLIGDGSDKEFLENQAKKIPDVYFLGRQEHDRIVEYLFASDIFALTSINAPNDREGTSTVIMEAMAAGLPIVTTKVGGNIALVKDGINGFLVDEKNSEAITEAVIKLLKDEKLYIGMKEKNLEDIKQKDWSIITKLVIRVYESIL